MLKSIRFENILSFGSNELVLDLESLNVFIGVNGSGKSNLINVIDLLRSLPIGLSSFFHKNGGTSGWLWQGEAHPVANIGITAVSDETRSLDYSFSFSVPNQMFRLNDERISVEHNNATEVVFLYRNDVPLIKVVYKGKGKVEYSKRFLGVRNHEPNVSILSQRYDPDRYPDITYLVDTFKKVKIYGRLANGVGLLRKPNDPASSKDYLEEDGSNLSLVIYSLLQNASVRNKLLEELQYFNPDITSIDVSIEGGTVQLFIIEYGRKIPASRLSDGTLRYFYLLGALLNPNPAPLICVEEPECCMHPDIIVRIADLLVETSEKTQVIVTTHSDILVDALTEQSGAIVITEKSNEGTKMQRLTHDEVEPFLNDYRLGSLWLDGMLGGVQ